MVAAASTLAINPGEYTSNKAMERRNREREILVSLALSLLIDVSLLTCCFNLLVVCLLLLDLSVDALQLKVFPGTEATTFHDDFFQAQDLVVNALDNVEARRYVDRYIRQSSISLHTCPLSCLLTPVLYCVALTFCVFEILF